VQIRDKYERMICEDSISISKMLARLVESYGYNVMVVHDGESVLSVVQQANIDLVLMDVELPGINGFEATKILRTKIKDWFPIIFLTAKTDPSSVVEGIENGGDDYLTKPVISDILAAKLKAMQRLAQMKEELDKANAQLVKISMTDMLTEVFNRRAFNQRLVQAWKISSRKSIPLSVALIDIDFFKKYNDFYGHMKGDDCLKEVAQCIKRTAAEENGVMVARYGGEEFVILMPARSIDAAQLIAQRVCQAVNDMKIPHEASECSEYVSISVGTAVTKDFSEEQGYSLLTHNTDLALYNAKDMGRNRALVYV
jgi:diguanylate cyclase (GGDEF)-like protein